MSKSDQYENDLLKWTFNNTPIANFAGTGVDAPASTSPGSLYLALHTADPGEAGNQTTNEVAYTGYSRLAVVRSSSGFVVTANQVVLAAQANFPQCTAAASVTVTHFSVGCAASGSGRILYSGPVSPNFGIALNTLPFLGAGTAVTED